MRQNTLIINNTNYMKSKEVKKKKDFIQSAIKHPGALHQELGVKAGKKIPAKKMAAAAKKGGKLGERARFAETLKKLHPKKKAEKKHAKATSKAASAAIMCKHCKSKNHTTAMHDKHMKHEKQGKREAAKHQKKAVNPGEKIEQRKKALGRSFL